MNPEHPDEDPYLRGGTKIFWLQPRMIGREFEAGIALCITGRYKIRASYKRRTT